MRVLKIDFPDQEVKDGKMEYKKVENLVVGLKVAGMIAAKKGKGKMLYEEIGWKEMQRKSVVANWRKGYVDLRVYRRQFMII